MKQLPPRILSFLPLGALAGDGGRFHRDMVEGVVSWSR